MKTDWLIEWKWKVELVGLSLPDAKDDKALTNLIYFMTAPAYEH